MVRIMLGRIQSSMELCASATYLDDMPFMTGWYQQVRNRHGLTAAGMNNAGQRIVSTRHAAWRVCLLAGS